ncbi:MAG TPA: hypothetical protein VND64_33240 [Pirellulales bacterium]|nr:hypothetical protein [Pirellulales bacterium]
MKANTRRAVLGSLVLVHALFPLATLAISHWVQGDFHAWWVARNAVRVVAFGELGLLVTMLGLIGAPSTWRWAAVALGSAECWCVLVVQHPDESQLNLAAYVLGPSALTLGLALAIRRTTVRSFDPLAMGDDDSGLQFSVGQLLVFTGMVAVLIAMAQQFLKQAVVVSPLLVVSEGSQIAVFTMVWATLRRRWRWVRAPVAAIVSCSVGVIVQSYLSESYFWGIILYPSTVTRWDYWEDLLSIPTFILLLSIFAAVTVQVAARCGYRPVQRRNLQFVVASCNLEGDASAQ